LISLSAPDFANTRSPAAKPFAVDERADVDAAHRTVAPEFLTALPAPSRIAYLLARIHHFRFRFRRTN
jgi:hypothetical protein